MAINLKETSVAGLQVSRDGTAANDVIRKSQLDAELATRPTSSEMSTAIAAVEHDPVTVNDSNSIDLTLSDQELQADLKLAADTIEQAAGGPTYDDFGPVAEADTLSLTYQNVTITSVERYDDEDALQATGVEDTDYELNAANGTLYILPGSNLIDVAEGDYVRATYTYGQVTDTSGLQVNSYGTAVRFGTEYGQAARGTHTHTNDHKAATGVAGGSVTVTVTPGQKVSAVVVLDPDGYLLVSEDGLGVAYGYFSMAGHTHSGATSAAYGFMSPSDKLKLDGLSSDPLQFNDSDTVDFTGDGENVTAEVKLGAGLTTDENGVAVDFDVVSESHTHDPASSVAYGYMHPSHVTKVDAMTYTYMGFAQDVIGDVRTGTPVGFSTTLGSSTNWFAILVSQTPISSPDSSYFSGRWCRFANSYGWGP